MDLATQDCDVVAENDDLNSQIVTAAPAQADQLKDSYKGKVEKREGHDPVSSSRAISGKSWSKCPDDILGTHRIRVRVESRNLRRTVINLGVDWRHNGALGGLIGERCGPPRGSPVTAGRRLLWAPSPPEPERIP